MFSTLMFRSIHLIIVSAGLSLFTQVNGDDSVYSKCYNTTSEMHCFSSAFEKLANVSEAQKHCTQFNATLPVIRNEEVESFVESFINDSDPRQERTFFWTSAHIKSSKMWHWLDCTVPLPNGFNLTADLLRKDVACLEFQPKNYSRIVDVIPLESMYDLSYICECSDSDIRFESGSYLQHSGRYYVAFKANATWYEARNKCLKDGCDLASFPDLENINFANWIDASPGMRYWIGLQLVEWMWNTSGEPSEVIFTNWKHRYSLGYGYDCMTIQKSCLPPNPCTFTWTTANCYSAPTTFTVCQTVTPLEPQNERDIYRPSKCATSSPTISVNAASSSVNAASSSTISVNAASSSTIPVNAASSSTIPVNAASTTTVQMAREEKMVRDDGADVRVGVGVGVGVGVPVLIGLLVVIIIVAVKRKRKNPKNGNTLAADSDGCELGNLPDVSARDEKEDITKGDVHSDTNDHDPTSLAANDDDLNDTTSATDVNNGGNIVYSDA